MTDVHRFIEAEKATFGVAFLCRLLKVARASFYAWAEGEVARRRRQEADDALAHEITVLHVASKHTYGSPRIHAELARRGRQVNRKRVERVMRERGITGVTRRRRRSLTRPAKRAVPAPDLIGRDFTAPAPGVKLVGDITFIPTEQGFFAVLKEEIGVRVWPDRATARAAIFTYIETFYNRRRLRKHPLWGYLTPLEIRQRHQQGHFLAA